MFEHTDLKINRCSSIVLTIVRPVALWLPALANRLIHSCSIMERSQGLRHVREIRTFTVRPSVR